MTSIKYPEDAIIEQVLNKIKDRADEGLKKYGVPMTRDDMGIQFWLDNAIEEALDWIVYLTKIKSVIQDKKASAENAIIQ